MKITDAFLGEHGALQAQFDRLDDEIPRATSVAEVREQAALLASALISHAHLEDELLFDALARDGRIDAGLLREMTSEHESIAQGLATAQGTGDLATGRRVLLQAVAEARSHFQKEEWSVFPIAEAVLGSEALAALGVQWAQRRTVHLEPVS